MLNVVEHASYQATSHRQLHHAQVRLVPVECIYSRIEKAVRDGSNIIYVPEGGTHGYEDGCIVSLGVDQGTTYCATFEGLTKEHAAMLEQRLANFGGQYVMFPTADGMRNWFQTSSGRCDALMIDQ